MVSILAGCGVAGEPEDMTQAQLLAKIDGRPLSVEEVTERLRLADLLCGFDRRVLQQIWVELDAGQLEFQDFVFGQYCPERSTVYLTTRPELGTVPEDQRLSLEIPPGIERASRSPGSSSSDDDSDNGADGGADDADNETDNETQNDAENEAGG